jgi:hypothetical protein
MTEPVIEVQTTTQVVITVAGKWRFIQTSVQRGTPALEEKQNDRRHEDSTR